MTANEAEVSSSPHLLTNRSEANVRKLSNERKAYMK